MDRKTGSPSETPTHSVATTGIQTRRRPMRWLSIRMNAMRTIAGSLLRDGRSRLDHQLAVEAVLANERNELGQGKDPPTTHRTRYSVLAFPTPSLSVQRFRGASIPKRLIFW